MIAAPDARTPPDWRKYIPHLTAWQKVCRGEANADEQRLVGPFLQFICGVDDLSFRPESVRESDFAEGRRYAGLLIGTAAKLSIAELRKAAEPPRQSKRGKR